MKKLIYTLSFVLVLLAMNSCSNLQKKLPGLDSILSPKPATSSIPVIPQEKTGYFILADGTYSTFQDYTVPKLKTPFLKVLINRLRKHGGGAIWLSYIDNNSKNNETLFLLVPQPLSTTKSKQNFMANGAIHFQEEKQKWEMRHKKEVSDSVNEATHFGQKEQFFLVQADSLLRTKVYVKSFRNRYSDVTGAVKSAIDVLSNARSNDIIQKCVLIGFSDFENDPVDHSLKPDPTIRIYNLISQPGKAKNSVPGSSEVSNEDYLLSIL